MEETIGLLSRDLFLDPKLTLWKHLEKETFLLEWHFSIIQLDNIPNMSTG